MHKNKIAWRFIAASHKCTTQPLSSLLSDILRFIQQSLRDKDNSHYYAHGIKRYFIVDTPDEIASYVARYRRTGHRRDWQLHTGDFATMYTTLPHDDLLSAMQRVTAEAWSYESNKLGIKSSDLTLCCDPNSDKPCRWESLSRPRRQHRAGAAPSKPDIGVLAHLFAAGRQRRVIMSLAQLNDCIAYLVRNTYLINGGSIYQQTVGIPMGTNCAPSLANLYLYDCESRYIDTLDCVTAQLFNHSFRYIDDTLSMDNPQWMHAVTVMYPKALVINDTTSESADTHSVYFLGMVINGHGGKLETSIYDRRDTFPFTVRRYPHMESLVPSTIVYGVFTGQLHRTYRLCTTVRGFIDYAAKVATRLIGNGCSERKLGALFRGYVTRHVNKYQHITHVEIITRWRDSLRDYTQVV